MEYYPDNTCADYSSSDGADKSSNDGSEMVGCIFTLVLVVVFILSKSSSIQIDKYMACDRF